MNNEDKNCRYCGEVNVSNAITCKKCKLEFNNIDNGSKNSINIEKNLSNRIDKLSGINWGAISVLLIIILIGLKYGVPFVKDFQINNSSNSIIKLNNKNSNNEKPLSEVKTSEVNSQLSPQINSEIKIVKSNKIVQFPDSINDFKDKTEIQQKTFSEEHVGALLNGSGRVSQIEKCSFPRKSIKYRGDNCVEVTLNNGGSRVAIYNSKEASSNLLNFNKDQLLEFTNCSITEIISWGFWSTVYCDQ